MLSRTGGERMLPLTRTQGIISRADQQHAALLAFSHDRTLLLNPSISTAAIYKHKCTLGYMQTAQNKKRYSMSFKPDQRATFFVQAILRLFVCLVVCVRPTTTTNVTHD
jgi:hypothetical protein